MKMLQFITHLILLASFFFTSTVQFQLEPNAGHNFSATIDRLFGGISLQSASRQVIEQIRAAALEAKPNGSLISELGMLSNAIARRMHESCSPPDLPIR